MKTLSKLEIINETVDHYSKNPNERRSMVILALEKTRCAYNGNNNQHCAVGRCMLTKLKRKGRNLTGNCEAIEDLVYDHGDPYDSRNIDSILQKKYHGHDVDFWYDLQQLHDRNDYWNDEGLTELGQQYVEQLKGKYYR